ncbi:MAG: peptidylprolyl isomerase [Candidatus Zixiibacteriota bacterium]|nr:MAG: peptidylprolyl isomerase [candidate division Zixibacteria bacterium]
MIKHIRAGIFLLAATIACSSGNKEIVPEVDFAYELLKMEEQGAVDSVIMDLALSCDDSYLIKAAAKTCGIVRDDRFMYRLSELCGHTDKAIREAAIFAIGEIKDTAALNSLAAVLHIEDFDSRLMSIEALGKIGDRKAAPYIKPFLKKQDEEAYEAALALWRIADSSSIGDLRLLAGSASGKALYGAVYSMFRLAPDSCVSQFVKVFENRKSGDSVYIETAAVAARGLGSSGDSTAILDIFEKHFDLLARSAKIELIRSLGRVGLGREGLERILASTDDNGLKRVIILSLGQIGNAKSRKVVEKYLHDSSLQVQLAAISALPEVNKSSPTNTLIKLKSEDKWQVRAEVARSLGRVKSSRSLKQLRLMLEDDDDRVKAAVIEGLGNYPVNRNIDIIKAALNGSDDTVVRSIAADVLGSSDNYEALDILAEAARKNVETDDVDFARSLVSAIGNFVDTTEIGITALNAIKKFLNHQNRIVRQDASSALGSLAPENFDPGTFDIDFSEEDFKNLRDLTKMDAVTIMETQRGIIKIKLDTAAAPRTAANFIRLIERGFYNDLTFHRVVQNFVVQGGCPRADGWGGPGYTIREEINPIRFKRGTIGMATSGRNTGSSQFFICLSDQPHLDGEYTAFGQVIEGWDTLDRIEIGDRILSVNIEKGRF